MDHLREDDGKRHIYLDPDGCGSGTGWVFVIVAAPTGVVYQNQGGGYSCAQYEQEGYLIPLFGSDLDEELKQIFVGELRGWGMRGQQWPVELLDRLRAAVGSFAVYGSGRHDELHPTALILDESRLAEAAEAWIPVLSPDGPSVLVWENSD
ncbi:DUF6210 family protein [Streptomyces sp. NBC_01799]|uniref:DUF6210 family protein n=1 Tax=Streptomyces sp. NBC_01800 TaxID=2975945 RepID=UPI002DD7C436|nr:DUF6210 family protein [Streptomyces sp. NBC_01800]WSA73574.1 DUF6210 family protein [Streptomyces sp. NBC_01800]WSA82088.1 DUF6210 family protein [Streptomyces sp. NBC_01799]